MNEKEVADSHLKEQTDVESEKSVVPLWLLGFYVLLLIWTIWNVMHYLD